MNGNRIGNQISAKGSVIFSSFNPRLNCATNYQFVEASVEEINLAVALATNAFNALLVVETEQLILFFENIIIGIENSENKLINFYCEESGLLPNRAKVELLRTQNQIKNFAKLLKDGYREGLVDNQEQIRLNPEKNYLQKIKIGVGPVVVFTASNFPFAYSTIGGDAIAALAAGCPVIIKSHPLHAMTSYCMAEIVHEAARLTNMPEGIFSHLNAFSYQVGEALVKHPAIKAVGFTGSVKGGLAISALAQDRKEPIPVFAEMGSCNPVFLFDEGVLQNNWVEKYTFSILNGAGQFCTQPGLFFVNRKSAIQFEFIEQLKQSILQEEAQCMLHPSIHDNFEKGIEAITAFVQCVRKEGDLPPNFGRQTLAWTDLETYKTNEVLQHEIFGPYSLVVYYDEMEELLDFIPSMNGQLTGTVIASELEVQANKHLILQLSQRVGRLILNGVSTGVEIDQAMQHGGPFPSSSDVRFTAVGIDSIERFTRSIALQNFQIASKKDFFQE